MDNKIQAVAYIDDQMNWGASELFDSFEDVIDWADENSPWVYSFRAFHEDWDYFMEGSIINGIVKWEKIVPAEV
jgi:hypothetical protein